MEYYDLILGFIPASIVGATGVLSAFGVTLSVGVAIGSVIAVLLILHALFVRTPTAPSEEFTRTTAAPPAGD